MASGFRLAAMASVNTPSSRIVKHRFTDLNHPFLMMENGDYPSGWNDFLHGRIMGKIDHAGDEQDAGAQMEETSARNLAYCIVNLLTWSEKKIAHPRQGALSWHQIRPWMVDEIYEPSMVKGFWTQEFSATGLRISLGRETISQRKKAGLAGLRWMSSVGIIPSAESDSPSLDYIESSRQAAFISMSSLMALPGPDVQPKYSGRQRPGDYDPHPLDEIVQIAKQLPSKAHVLYFLTYLAQGFRKTEAEENLLVPGTIYRRPERYDKFKNPTYPQHPYRIQYSGLPDKMTGVLPPMKLAFQRDEIAETSCKYFILGKGPKLREVFLVPALLRAFWRYFLKERAETLAENGIAEKDQPAALLLDDKARPLKAEAVYRAILRANKRLNLTVRVTSHPLRHTFACLFLEASIEGEARRDGLDPAKLTPTQIGEYGGIALLILKKDLGHQYIETTQIYLDKLTRGKIGLRLRSHLAKIIDDLENELV
jgi:integrase